MNGTSREIKKGFSPGGTIPYQLFFKAIREPESFESVTLSSVEPDTLIVTLGDGAVERFRSRDAHLAWQGEHPWQYVACQGGWVAGLCRKWKLLAVHCAPDGQTRPLALFKLE